MRIKGSYNDEVVTSQLLNLRGLCNEKTIYEKEKKEEQIFRRLAT
jgi:hypothetical protein